MKRVWIIIIIVILLSSCANTYGGKVNPEELDFQKIYELENIDSDELFSRTIEWLAKTFNDSREVIELKDKERGKIVGNGIVNFTDVVATSQCKYMVTIDIKDNKFRITFTNYVWLDTSFGDIPLNTKYHIDQIKSSFLELSDNLFEYVSNYSEDTW